MPAVFRMFGAAGSAPDFGKGAQLHSGPLGMAGRAFPIAGSG